MVGKMGGEAMSHLNSSSGNVEPSLYYPGQKRPGEDGVGNQLAAMGHQSRVITEDYKVPDRMVGFIIGRGGEQITRIQLESGCKIQIAADSGGLMERPCSLTGTPESIDFFFVLNLCSLGLFVVDLILPFSRHLGGAMMRLLFSFGLMIVLIPVSL
ncbi:hypothetical protein INR49_020967 [Caranx melampygus]|nr:hypothetical protein INR49_020967 [Caranx melampygus]